MPLSDTTKDPTGSTIRLAADDMRLRHPEDHPRHRFWHLLAEHLEECIERVHPCESREEAYALADVYLDSLPPGDSAASSHRHT